MNIFSGLALGVVQGLTEFLPVSSSGHLILARELFGFTAEFSGAQALAFDAILQLGTLLAVFVYFRRDVRELVRTFFALLLGRRVEARAKILLAAICIGTLPALTLGLLLERFMETTFRSAFVVALMLLLGSVLFAAAEWFYARRLSKSSAKGDGVLDVRSGFWIGCFQVLALVPGMSRSGSTISGGLFMGLSREAAARFSFLLSLPIILGTGLKKLWDLVSEGTLGTGGAGGMGAALFVGFLAAFFVGYGCIAFLLQYLRTRSLYLFIWYRVGLAALVLGVLWYS